MNIPAAWSTAELALAAYAPLQSGLTRNQLNALRDQDRGLSLEQAREFALRYPEVITQVNDLATGFSMTAFADPTGGIALTMRGTDQPLDDWLLTNSDILINGAGYQQIAAMYNAWQRLTHVQGAEITIYSVDLSDPLSPVVAQQVINDLGAPDAPLIAPSQPVHVTGHSLGGHLAIAFAGLFPDSTNDVYAFNAPGFKDSTQNRSFFAALGGNLPLGEAPSGVPITNVIADAVPGIGLSWSPIAGLHSRPGTPLDVAIENQASPTDEPNPPFGSWNHSQQVLTDSLAVFALLAKLAPEISANAYDPILGGATLGTAGGLERIVDSLRKLFGNNSGLLEIGNSKRDALYQEIYGLLRTQQFLAHEGQFQIIPSGAAELASKAYLKNAEGLAYRYALRELNSFVAVGPTSPYEAHNLEGELDVFVSAGDTPAGMTERYLADRAQMLSSLMAANLKDTDALPVDGFADQILFTDLVKRPSASSLSGRSTELLVYQTGAPVFFRNSSTKVVTFGADQADAVLGRNNTDRLYGGMGSDVLIGGKSNDYLEGGAGMDVYAYSAETFVIGDPENDGNDEIRDTDGKGAIRYTFTGSGTTGTSSRVIGGAALQSSSTQWRSPDGKFVFHQQGSDLLVTFDGDAGGSLMIRDFDFAKAASEGFLGIRLVEALPQAPANPARTYYGDKQNWDSIPSTPEIDPVDDGFGNYVRADGQDGRPDLALVDRADVFFGSAADQVERFITAGGDDTVHADGPNSATSSLGGRDLVEAGAGRDIVLAGAGNDWVEGGAGADVLSGNAGDDVLFAGISVFQTLTLAQAIQGGEIAPRSSAAAELLSGDAGRDVLIGEATDDLLLGGEDGDLVVGGGGDDTVYGDAWAQGAGRDWSIRRVEVAETDAKFYVVEHFNFALEKPLETGAADTLYGGAGNDWIFAGAGNDYADGGAGNDVLFGEAGGDILIGGDGDDDLNGDSATVDELGLSGDDYLDGGKGDDTLRGGKGDDILAGGEGSDTLIGGEGADLIWGGAGTDALLGGAGKDTYLYFRGDGEDIIIDPDITTEAQYRSSVVLGPGIDRNQVRFRLGSLMLDFGGGDALHFQDFDHEDPWSTPVLDAIHFADGEVMTFEDILEQGFDFDGTSADDEIHGTVLTDSIFAGAGNDTAYGKAGDDLLDGGEGNDSLFGDAGNDELLGGDGEDMLDGGAGDDVLQGGAEADAYVIYGGMGNDVITDGEGGEANVLQLGAGLASENLAAARSGDDLVVSLRGLQDSVKITDYYTRPQGWVVRGFGGDEVALQEVVDRPDPHGDDYVARLWADTKLGATARVYGQAYAIGWKPLDGNTFEGGHERAFADYLRQKTVETYTRFDPPNDQLAQNTFETIEHEVAAFGGREGTTFRWVHHSFESGYVESDDAFIQGSWIQLEQLQSAGQALLTLRPDAQLIGYQLNQWTDPTLVVSYDSGSEAILAFLAIENEVESYSQFAEVIQVDTEAGAWLHEKGQIVGNRVLADILRLENRYLAVNEIVGGGSDNSIVAGSSPLSFALTTLIDGGGGNDVLIGDGGLLYGNTGDDSLAGTDAIFIGGDGDDTISGLGGSRFVYTATETGIDTISEGARATESYLDWYFGGLGIENWRDSEWTAPVVLRSDPAMLANLESAGVLVRDVVSFGPGVALQDLALDLESGATLTVRWNGGAAGFDLAVPDERYGWEGAVLTQEDWEHYSLGEGVELFEFADGSRYTLEEILQLASEEPEPGDRYQFLRSSGSQVIEGPWTGVDFGPGIALADLYTVNDGSDDLVFGVRADSALGRIPDWYADPLAVPQWEFAFADGTVLDADGITRLGRTWVGSPSNDLLVADPFFASALHGLEGSDRLAGGAGNDLLDGGAGSDLLGGGAGDDLYVFGAGYGTDLISEISAEGGSGIDTVQFTAGTTPGDVAAAQEFADLVLALGEGEDTLRIVSWFEESAGSVERFAFADGTVWSAAEVEALLPAVEATEGGDQLLGGTGADLLEGLAGDDELYGFAGDDTLRGGPGNDHLAGGAGEDRYEFAPGDGVDAINDRSGANALAFDAAIAPESVTVTRDEGNLYLVLGGGERVGVQSWFWEDTARGFRTVFADGTQWDAAELERRVALAPASVHDDILWGSEGADAIAGLEGDDIAYGNGGDDVLEGGAGADEIRGGAGFDLLRGGEGEDTLEDWEDRNAFDAGAGDDYVYLEGPGLVIGGAGDDWLDLHGPGAVVAFNPGDGADTIYAAQAFTLSIGGGIAPADLALSADGDDLVLHVGEADAIRLTRQWESEPQAWPAITLQLFGSVHAYDFTAAIAAFRAAQAADPALAGYALGEALAANLLSSSESAALGGAAAHQYATAGSTAALSDAQIVALLQDELFGLAPQAIAVDGANSAPVLALPLADQSFEAGAAFEFLVPADAFVDADGDALALSAGLYGGGALPAWLTFDPASGRFTGTPLAADIGLSHLAVTATDPGGASAAADFGLVVRAAAGSTVTGGAGDDHLQGGAGDETLIARGGSDYLYGDEGNDLLRGGGGADVLQGGAGNDVLRGGAGQNVLEGGAGDDLIYGGAGSGFIAGGAGNDILRVGEGNDVIAFNAGDGMDTIYGGRDGGNTLSFGGGIRYSDIRLSKAGRDLVVSTGEGEGVTLKNWYGGNHSVLSLQVVLDATEEFDASAGDPLFNRRVQTFDFLGMVGAYDAARAAAPGLTSWEITNALLAFHLGGADDAAIGGDLAYWYGRNRGLTGISLQAAQQVIGAATFGAEAQSLRPFSGLQEGFAKLA